MSPTPYIHVRPTLLYVIICQQKSEVQAGQAARIGAKKIDSQRIAGVAFTKSLTWDDRVVFTKISGNELCLL